MFELTGTHDDPYRPPPSRVADPGNDGTSLASLAAEAELLARIGESVKATPTGQTRWQLNSFRSVRDGVTAHNAIQL